MSTNRGSIVFHLDTGNTITKPLPESTDDQLARIMFNIHGKMTRARFTPVQQYVVTLIGDTDADTIAIDWTHVIAAEFKAHPLTAAATAQEANQ